MCGRAERTATGFQGCDGGGSRQVGRDPELEPLIEEIVLRRLKTWPIDGSVQNYLNQTRNSKAVPLLLDLLKASKDDQGSGGEFSTPSQTRSR